MKRFPQSASMKLTVDQLYQEVGELGTEVERLAQVVADFEDPPEHANVADLIVRIKNLETIIWGEDGNNPSKD